MAKAVLIHSSIWNSRLFRALRKREDPLAMMLAMYLTANEQSKPIGLYAFDPDLVARMTMIPPDQLDAKLAILAELDFVTVDTKLSWVFVHSAAKYQYDLIAPGAALKPTDKRVTGIRREVEACHSAVMAELFKARYNDACALGYHADTFRDERTIRSEAGTRLHGPPLTLLPQ